MYWPWPGRRGRIRRSSRSGLLVSVALMGVAASLVARLLSRFRWLAWVGLAIVFYVSVTMIHDGLGQVLQHLPRR